MLPHSTQIINALTASGMHSTYSGFIKPLNLRDTFNVYTDFTVLAPSDAAFSNSKKETDGILQGLSEEEKRGVHGSILEYRILNGMNTYQHVAVRK